MFAEFILVFLSVVYWSCLRPRNEATTEVVNCKYFMIKKHNIFWNPPMCLIAHIDRTIHHHHMCGDVVHTLQPSSMTVIWNRLAFCCLCNLCYSTNMFAYWNGHLLLSPHRTHTTNPTCRYTLRRIECPSSRWIYVCVCLCTEQPSSARMQTNKCHCEHTQAQHKYVQTTC